jgi:hypothetical protein
VSTQPRTEISTSGISWGEMGGGGGDKGGRGAERKNLPLSCADCPQDRTSPDLYRDIFTVSCRIETRCLSTDFGLTLLRRCRMHTGGTTNTPIIQVHSRSADIFIRNRVDKKLAVSEINF